MNFSTDASILVVDESESICELIELLLVRVGYEVRTATTAACALRIAREMPALNVLLCGLDLPDMPGKDLAERLSPVHSNMSVVFVASSYALNDGTGCVDVLEKPFTIGELRNVVRTALNSRPDSSKRELCAMR